MQNELGGRKLASEEFVRAQFQTWRIDDGQEPLKERYTGREELVIEYLLAIFRHKLAPFSKKKQAELEMGETAQKVQEQGLSRSDVLSIANVGRAMHSRFMGYHKPYTKATASQDPNNYLEDASHRDDWHLYGDVQKLRRKLF